MATEDRFLKAVKELREAESKRSEKRKFDQTVDLIVNLKEFEVKKHGFNAFVQVPHKLKEKKIAGFFEKDSEIIDAIKKDDFGRYKEKKDVKKLIKSYDFFIANAKLMPAVATSFGRILGPVGKMPSPQMGIVPTEEEKMIRPLLNKINSSVRIRVKEPSLKIGVAKESLTDDEVVENAVVVYKKILESLPKGIDNVRNVKLKFTMGKPVAIEIK
jgi:large subunit ribosomal protein L1